VTAPGRRQREFLFMAHVVPGLEGLAWEELLERADGAERVATWSAVDRRAGVLLFRTRESLSSLLDLRLTEDVFAVVAFTKRLPAGRDGLRAIREMASTGEGMDAALAYHREVVAARRGRPRYRVVARKAGPHAFRRVDAQQACEAGLARRFPRWRLLKESAPLEFWFQIIGEAAILAVRLSSVAMRQRTYRGVSLPAALKPTVAHALVRLAREGAGALLIDPLCGTGTLLAEAADAGLSVLGGDIQPEAVRAARLNLGGAAASAGIALWDAARLPLRDGIAGCVACNLPWGKKGSAADLTQLYQRFLGEARRIVKSGGCVAVLTSEREQVERVLARVRGLSVERRLQVIVRGADAWLLVLRKAL
jgi:23S rRNA G2445 N2-methylase RlmL